MHGLCKCPHFHVSTLKGSAVIHTAQYLIISTHNGLMVQNRIPESTLNHAGVHYTSAVEHLGQSPFECVTARGSYCQRACQDCTLPFFQLYDITFSVSIHI